MLPFVFWVRVALSQLELERVIVQQRRYSETELWRACWYNDGDYELRYLDLDTQEKFASNPNVLVFDVRYCYPWPEMLATEGLEVSG